MYTALDAAGLSAVCEFSVSVPPTSWSFAKIVFRYLHRLSAELGTHVQLYSTSAALAIAIVLHSHP